MELRWSSVLNIVLVLTADRSGGTLENTGVCWSVLHWLLIILPLAKKSSAPGDHAQVHQKIDGSGFWSSIVQLWWLPYIKSTFSQASGWGLFVLRTFLLGSNKVSRRENLHSELFLLPSRRNHERSSRILCTRKQVRNSIVLVWACEKQFNTYIWRNLRLLSEYLASQSKRYKDFLCLSALH